jgi:PAS domain S-box-containing protein
MSGIDDPPQQRGPWLALWLALGCEAAAAWALMPGLRAAPPGAGAATAAAIAAALIGTSWAIVASRRWASAIARRQIAAETAAGKAASALRQLREALDELPSGLEIYDSDDRLIFFNKRLMELYPWIDFEHHVGQRFEDILRESIRQGRIPAAAGREEQWLKDRLATRGTRLGPVLQSLKSGLWINTYERRSLSNGVVGVRLEVTDLVKRTRELQESRERLQAIISSAAVGIVSTDTAGTIVEANAAAESLFGHAHGEMAGRPLSALIPRLDLVDDARPPPTSDPPPVRHKEVEGRASDGRALKLQVSVSELGAAQTRQFVAVIADVTEREAAEQVRQVLEAQLRQAQKIESIGTLASGIAHDFNNVLGSILGNAELARDDLEKGANDQARSTLAQVCRAAERARRLVQQILTFSRQQSVQRTTQALQPVVEEGLNLLRATLPAQVVLATRFDDRPVFVSADAIQIEQVVLNLCTNAWQAMGDRGGRIEIGVDVHELTAAEVLRTGLGRGPHARLSVVDDGAGMDEATRVRAFDPFFTTKPTGAGTGLGLSVVHGIVKSHDGAILVDSAPGRGARFDFFLPLCEAPEGEARAPSSRAGGVVGRGERVLYLDDDDVMPLMVDRLLQRSGYVVHCFSDPAQAVAAVRARPNAFDVLVTDFNMPGLSGLDVVRAVADIRPALPTLLTSGLVSDEMRASALDLGVSEVLEKQNTLEQLATAIERALGRRPGPAAED